jgi:nucleotide-binding universal stress UspA family protein
VCITGALSPAHRLLTLAHGEFELGNDGPSVILVGVDESVTASRAAAYAVGLARRQGARVVVVYVEPNATIMLSSPAGASAYAAENAAHTEIAKELSATMARAARELGISLEFVTARGDAFHEIARIADETRADAIVVGASLKAGHRLLGSIAVRLVKAGKWPVTVVP